MKISYKNILLIIGISFSIGLVYNYLNPKGISLLKEKKELVFGPDSLFIPSNELKENVLSDSVSNKVNSVVQNQSKTKEIEQTKSEKPEIKVEAFSEPRALKIEQAYRLHIQGIKFIDARMPDDYAAGHIKGAYNIPFDGDESYRDILNSFSKDEILVVYCEGTDCDLSIYLSNEIFEKGFKRVYVFFGGWNEWVEKNYPVSKN
jgi:rhodanese-related sulfurtransferase